jgi:hypothetical protein
MGNHTPIIVMNASSESDALVAQYRVYQFAEAVVFAVITLLPTIKCAERYHRPSATSQLSQVWGLRTSLLASPSELHLSSHYWRFSRGHSLQGDCTGGMCSYEDDSRIRRDLADPLSDFITADVWKADVQKDHIGLQRLCRLHYLKTR